MRAWKRLEVRAVSVASRVPRRESGVGGGRYGPGAATAASEASPFFLRAFLPLFFLYLPPSFSLYISISVSPKANPGLADDKAVLNQIYHRFDLLKKGVILNAVNSDFRCELRKRNKKSAIFGKSDKSSAAK